MANNFNSSNEIFNNMLKGLKDGNNKLTSIDKTTKEIKNKKASKDVEETKSNVMTPEKNNEDDAKYSILSSISSKMDNHYSVLNNINSSIATVTNRVTSSLTMLSAINLNLIRITSVLSAFRADYILTQNGKTPRGESYVNKSILTNANDGYAIPNPTKEMSKFISKIKEVGNFANLMSNAVRSKIGAKLDTGKEQKNLLEKFLGEDIAPFADMFSMAIKNLTGIDTTSGLNLATSLGGKLTGKSSERFKKDTFGKLRNFTDTLENDPNSGMIKNMIGSILGEKLDNLGIERKNKKEKESDPNMVMSALAPHADEIRQVVEGIITGFQRKPKIIPEYAVPVWVVNYKDQKDYIKSSGRDKETKEEELLNERIKDILEGRNTNKLDRNGNELLKLDYEDDDNVTFSGKYAEALIENNKKKGKSRSKTIKEVIKNKEDYRKQQNRIGTEDFYEMDENGGYVKVTNSDEDLENYNERNKDIQRERSYRSNEIDEDDNLGWFGKKLGKIKNFAGKNIDEAKNVGGFLKGVIRGVKPAHASGTVNKTQLKNDEGITGTDVEGQEEAVLHPGEKVLSASQVKEVNQLNDVTAMLGDVSYKILLLTQVANQFSTNFVTYANKGKITQTSFKVDGVNSIFKKTGAAASKIGQTVLSLMGKVKIGTRSVMPSSEPEEGEGEKKPGLLDKAKDFLKETKVGQAAIKAKEAVKEKIREKKEAAKQKIKDKLDNAYDNMIRKLKLARETLRQKKQDFELKRRLKKEEKAQNKELKDKKKFNNKERLKEKAHNAKERLKEKAFNAKERLKEKAHNIKERVKEIAFNAKERLKDMASNLFNRLIGKASSIAGSVIDVVSSGASALTKVAGSIPIIGKIAGPAIGIAALAGIGGLVAVMIKKASKGKSDGGDGGLLKKLSKKAKGGKDKEKKENKKEKDEKEKKKSGILSSLKEKLELREVYIDKETGQVKRKKDNSVVMKRDIFGRETEEPLVVGKKNKANTLQFMARLKSHELKLVPPPKNESTANLNNKENKEKEENKEDNSAIGKVKGLFGKAKDGLSSLFSKKDKENSMIQQILAMLMPMMFMNAKMKKSFMDMLKSPFGALLKNNPEKASGLLFALNGGSAALGLGSAANSLLNALLNGNKSNNSSSNNANNSGSSSKNGQVTSANIADKNAGYSDNAAVAYSQYKQYMAKQEAINEIYEEMGLSKAQTDSEGNAITTSQIVAIELANGNNGSNVNGSASKVTNEKASIYASAAGKKPEDFFTSTMPDSSKSSGFYRNDGVTFHGGIDIAAPEGTPIYTPIGGKVIARWDNHSECGNFIAIQDADGFVHRMMHFQKPALYKEGDEIQPGALIAYVGSTGQSTGPHLHYDICTNSDSLNGQSYAWKAGSLINPEEYYFPNSTTAAPSTSVNSEWDAKLLKENQIKDGIGEDKRDNSKEEDSDSLGYNNNNKGKSDKNKSGKGSGSYFTKKPLYFYQDQNDLEHIYQKDYDKYRYNTNKDKTIQTLSDSGCGPAVAATVGNIYAGMGSNKNNNSKFLNAANFALSKNYKETDGGYLIATFIFERYKLKFRELLGSPKLL